MNFKTLIVTTGTREWILKEYVPSLMENAKYTGDLLLLDYNKLPDHFRIKDPLLDSDIEKLQKEYPDRILFKRVDYQFPCLSSDRIIQFFRALGDKKLYKEYDVIMCTDGNDIRFFGPIDELLEMAKEDVCYTIEREGHVCKAWIEYTKFPNAEAVWKSIKDKPIVNAGMIVGPSKNMMILLGYIASYTHYNPAFGADQLLLNALIYHYKIDAKLVDSIWNYAMACGIARMVSIRNNQVVTLDQYSGRIRILHKNAMQHGAVYVDLDAYMKLKYPACQLPNEGTIHSRKD